MRIRPTGLTLALVLGLIAALPTVAAHSGRHGESGGHHGMADGPGSGTRHSGAVASDQRHSNDDYVKAAAQEEDKLLDTKIKSICRGC
jgi:hypothetical protein